MWHDLCQRTLGRQLDAAPDLERLHALRDGVAGFGGPPERLDRRSRTPPPEVPKMLSVETGRWAVDAARRVVEEFHRRAGHRQGWRGDLDVDSTRFTRRRRLVGLISPTAERLAE